MVKKVLLSLLVCAIFSANTAVFALDEELNAIINETQETIETPAAKETAIQETPTVFQELSNNKEEKQTETKTESNAAQNETLENKDQPALQPDTPPVTNKKRLAAANDVPVWADYVAPKYRNPKTDVKRSGAVSELVIGVILTDLIFTAPIGIPMIVHGTTRVKMASYANRKSIFDKKIKKASFIQNDAKRQAEYKKILKECHLKESTKRHYAKKAAKQAEKEAKKAQKKSKELEL